MVAGLFALAMRRFEPSRKTSPDDFLTGVEFWAFPVRARAMGFPVIECLPRLAPGLVGGLPLEERGATRGAEPAVVDGQAGTGSAWGRR
jgi:hypothetical protein